jgi:ABC-type sugar transport system substrate-binding protein
VELILARAPNSDRIYLMQVLRRELGKVPMVFRTWPEHPEPAGQGTDSFSPAQLAEAIQQAIERGAAALIVEPLDDPVVRGALNEAVEKGLAVLTLDQPVAPSVGPRIPCVTYASFTEPGREIVQAILDAAKQLRRDQGRILVLHRTSFDVYDDRRLESLTGPLKAAGKTCELIPFEGGSDVAQAALEKSLAVNPDVAIVLADEYEGLSTAFRVKVAWKESNHPEFFLGGYLAYDYRSANDLLAQATAFGDRNVESYSVKVFQTIRSLMDGKPVGDRIELPIRVHKKPILFVPSTAKDGARS